MIVHLHGHLGQDAEILGQDNDHEYVKLSVAEKSVKDKKVQWVTVFIHHIPNKLLPYLIKGSLVYVVGRLKVNMYEGNPQLIINANEIQLLANPKGGESSTS
ncbi:MAG: single-stranded DNA-binding protein [Bacteroidia bacterium]